MDKCHLAKIYIITCDELDTVYIGSTCKSINTRMNGHRSDYKRWIEGTRLTKCSSFELIQYESATIVEIPYDHPCQSMEERYDRERYHIENSDCVNVVQNLNATKEDIARKQHDKYVKNKDHIKGYNKEYNIVNQVEIRAKKKVYRNAHPNANRDYHRENFTEISNKAKSKRLLTTNVTFVCDCGKVVRHNTRYAHWQTETHLAIMAAKALAV